MPYFKDINLLFIHIPKTGGTSIEEYFYEKYNIPLTLSTLKTSKLATCAFLKWKNITLQHLTIDEILKNALYFDINTNNLKIISIVRNPYDRMISELFYLKLIDIDSSSEFVEIIITNFLNDSNEYDNHKLPQHKFLEINNIISDKYFILRTESLTEDMIKLGYTDFNKNENVGNKINYKNYLTHKSIILLNIFYEKDFVIFNYEML